MEKTPGDEVGKTFCTYGLISIFHMKGFAWRFFRKQRHKITQKCQSNLTEVKISFTLVVTKGDLVYGQYSLLQCLNQSETQDSFVALVSAALSFLRVAEALNAGKRPICENFSFFG